MRARQDELAPRECAARRAEHLDSPRRTRRSRGCVVELERQTYEDSLTGLANRRRLDQRLATSSTARVRHGRPLAVAIADLDHFKASTTAGPTRSATPC